MSDTTERPDRMRGIGERREEILNVRREIARRGTVVGKLTERIGNTLAAPWFFLLFLALNLGWIVFNLGIVPGVMPWDPPPFMLLATIASVEAPLFALLILMAQSRSRRIDELREEVSLQVDLYVEQQTSAVLRMLADIHDELGIEPEDDRDIETLAEPMDPKAVMEQVQESLTEGEEGGRTPGE